MPDPFYVRLEEAVAQRGMLCAGLDPSSELLGAWGLPDDADGAERLARTAIAAVRDVVGVVKPQVAFFERFGSRGFLALERVIADARAAGLLVIADAKRGDIGSTNEGYAQAWMDDASPLAVDAMTLSCYLGAAALEPVIAAAAAHARGAFCVVASSNPEGRGIQGALIDGRQRVESALLAELAELDASHGGTKAIGAVIGATRRPEGLAGFPGPVLVPGVGAQGAGPDEVRWLRRVLGHGAICANVSRELLAAGPDATALRSAASRTAEALR